MPHARGDGRRVALDLHPPAAAVPELAAREVGVDLLGVQLQAGGQPLDDRGQAGSVGLAGGGQAQDHFGPSLWRSWLGDGGPAPRAAGTSGYARGRSPPLTQLAALALPVVVRCGDGGDARGARGGRSLAMLTTFSSYVTLCPSGSR